MASCEQELCPFWDGHGCPCAVLDFTEQDRQWARRNMGIRWELPDDEHA